MSTYEAGSTMQPRYPGFSTSLLKRRTSSAKVDVGMVYVNIEPVPAAILSPCIALSVNENDFLKDGRC